MTVPPAIFPTFDAFSSEIAAGKPQLVWTTLIADLETPITAMLKLMRDSEPCFLLESVEGGENRGRYSIIGLKPDLMWRCRGQKAEINRNPLHGGVFEPCSEEAVAALEALLESIRLDIPESLPPMAAGLIGYLGYDMAKLIETLPAHTPDSIGIPDAYLMRPGIMLIFDAVNGVIYVITPVWHQYGMDVRNAYTEACARLTDMLTALAAPLPVGSQHVARPAVPVAFEPNMSREAFHSMVVRAKEYIVAGDIFQVVPSQRFSAPFTLPPFALYRSLRHLNPSPFLFYLAMGDFTLIGSSPEILVRLRDDTITIRPIAGTRPRGKTREEDLALEAELLADPKERAEHLMLLDLGRNDVGRCTLPDSVRVTEEFVVERYSHVMHIVSNVEGRRDPAKTPFACLMSGFPAGTVSGAPKIRAMQIIDELEPVRRSFYAGCVGYFSASGAVDTCITLRTALIKDGILHVQAGGGVVADSDPELEYQESCSKAKAIMRAADNAVQFCGS